MICYRCRLKSADFPDAYLANAGASTASPNQIYVWPKQLGWRFALQWYLQDPKHSGIKGLVEGETESSQDPAVLKKQEEATKAREDNLKKLEEAAKAREDALKKEEEALEARKSGLKTQEEASKAKEEQLSASHSELQLKQQQLRDAEADLKAREAKVAQSETSTFSDDLLPPGKEVSKDDTKNVEIAQENERLRKELAETKATLERAGKAGSQRWSANASFGRAGSLTSQPRSAIAAQQSGRTLPPVKRPASSLPNGFTKSLAMRAVWPGRVEEL